MQTLKLKRSDQLADDESNQLVAQGLAQILADTFSIYLKTLNYHWNVEGGRFVGIHKLTEEQYEQMGEAIDVIAERIRALGYYAPASLSDYSKMTTIKDASAGGLTAGDMLEDLVKNHAELIDKLKTVIDSAETNHDTTSVDLLSSRRNFHEQAAWMLRSLTK